MVAARGHAERGEEKSWEWGGESSWSSTTWSAAATATAEAGTRGHAATAEARGDHVGKRSNRWRAPVWIWWSAGLGQLRGDLVHGPKTKFSVLGPLYIFH